MPSSTELIETARLDLHLIPPLELFMLHEDPDNADLLSDRDFTNPHNELTHEHSLTLGEQFLPQQQFLKQANQLRRLD